VKRSLWMVFTALPLIAASCDNECIGHECVDVPPPEAGPVNMETDWCEVRDDVFPSCTSAGCHGANGLDPILSGDDEAVYAGLQQNGSNGAPYVVPGSPELSYLWRKVEGTHKDPEVGGTGSTMPIGGFTGVFDADEELALRVKLRDWIANGAGTSCQGAADAGVSRDTGNAVDAGQVMEAGSPVDTGPASVCGDGEATGDEACDDGNSDNGDGCENDCTLTPSPYCAVVGRLAACTGCHGNSGGFTMGNNLQAWLSNTVNQQSSNNRGNGMPYITSGDKERSFLWLKVANRQGQAGGGSPGGAMPPGGSWPTSAVDLLGEWIDADLPTPENCP